MSDKSDKHSKWSDKLTLKNRKIWMFRVKAAIMKARSGVALEEGRSKDNSEKHNIAIGIIAEHLNDSDMDLVDKHNDAIELLKKLNDRYVGHSKIRVPQLYAEMSTFKMKTSETAREYTQRLKSIVDELQQCDEAASDAYAISIALIGLREEYKEYTKAFYVNPTEMPKDLDDLAARLMMVEISITTSKPTSSSKQIFYTGNEGVKKRGAPAGGSKGNSGGFRGKCFACGKDGHRAVECPNAKKRKFCTYCKTEGHTEDVCRRKKREEKSSEGDQINPLFFVGPMVAEPSREEEIPTVAEPSREEEIPTVAEPSREEEIPTVAEPSREEKIPTVAEPSKEETTAAGSRTTTPNQQKYIFPGKIRFTGEMARCAAKARVLLLADRENRKFEPTPREYLDSYPKLERDTWYVDSGAYYHVSPDQRSFHKYNVLDEPITLLTGNGPVKAVGRGDILLRPDNVSYDGPFGSQRGIVLHDVLYVPNFPHRLISLKQLANRGAEFNGWKNMMWVNHPRQGWSFTSECSGSVYSVRGFEMVPYRLTMPTIPANDRAQTWHSRMGHLSYGNLARMVDENLVSGIDVSATEFRRVAASAGVCEPCVMAKHPHKPFPESLSHANRRLGLLHMDLCGPMTVDSADGHKYIATFLDDYSEASHVVFLKRKSDAPQAVRETIVLLEKHCGEKVQDVRTDRGREYLNSELSSFFAENGIRHQTSAPYTPQQNGRAERLNRTLLEKARSMLYESKLPTSMWMYAVSAANYVRSRSPVREMSGTPFERFYKKKPAVDNLRVFGCTAYVRVPEAQQSKLEPRSMKGLFVGYELGSKAYRVLMPDGQLKISRDVIFNEKVLEGLSGWEPDTYALHGAADDEDDDEVDDDLPCLLDDYSDYESDDEGSGSHTQGAESSNVSPSTSGASTSLVSGSPSGQSGSVGGSPSGVYGASGSVAGSPSSGNGASGSVGGSPGDGSGGESARSASLPQSNPEPELCRSSRANKGQKPQRLNLSAVKVPNTYEEAMNCPEASMWKQAMDEEMASIRSNQVWTLEVPPKGFSSGGEMGVYCEVR
ncbi:hypothetical protein Vafri_10006 [Volvox africanus]|uniref:Retrovirus-related Pol polyprotein from transposon TNT 1-94 n=1 Tax=Volvox africanus TaxID=51714 RepID=A0A8J4B5N2_9CHLO|nr:hypothetical protein Vafri_10006 [Volvox africanus]